MRLVHHRPGSFDDFGMFSHRFSVGADRCKLLVPRDVYLFGRPRVLSVFSVGADRCKLLVPRDVYLFGVLDGPVLLWRFPIFSAVHGFSPCRRSAAMPQL